MIGPMLAPLLALALGAMPPATTAASAPPRTPKTVPTSTAPTSTTPTTTVPTTTVPTTAVPTTTAARPLRIAALGLERNGIGDDVGRIVDESLLAELRKLTRTSVVGMDEVRQMLDFEAARQSLGCNDDSSCLADLADALGVDVLVAGGITRVGDESVVVVRRIDQRTANVAGVFTRRLVAQNGEELLAAIGPAVEQLFGEVPLRPGQTRGVDPKLALRLNPPPLPSWLPITTGAVGAAVLVGAGVGFISTRVQLDDYQRFARDGGTAGVDGGTLIDKGAAAESTWLASWVALGAGAALVGVTAALVPLTDWSSPEQP